MYLVARAWLEDLTISHFHKNLFFLTHNSSLLNEILKHFITKGKAYKYNITFHDTFDEIASSDLSQNVPMLFLLLFAEFTEIRQRRFSISFRCLIRVVNISISLWNKDDFSIWSKRQLRFAAECADTSYGPAVFAAGKPWKRSHSLRKSNRLIKQYRYNLKLIYGYFRKKLTNKKHNSFKDPELSFLWNI